jgi:hypothetical protein
MPGPDCRGELVANQGKRPIRLNARPRLRLRKWCRDGAPRSHLRERVHGQRLVPLIIRWSSAAWWSIPPAAVGGGRPARRKFDARGPITMAAARCCLTGAPAPGHHARPTEVASCFAEWAEHPGPREARLRQRRATAFVSRRPRRGEDRKAFASGHGGHGYTRADLSASCPERPRTCLSPDRLGPRDARRMKPTW